ncbi:MAG: hypothetical protein FWD61_14410 [Phycisphaerales bacterium]|nr:hypothetical protein [Phycisphaerales bacterium]
MALSVGCSVGTNGSKPIVLASSIGQAVPFVKPKETWGADHLYEFLNALPDEARLSLMKSLEMVKENAGLSALNGRSQDVRNIQKEALWISSNILTYPFRNESKLNYHELATWVASNANVDTILSGPAFVLERGLHKQMFSQLWDKLTSAQRSELLEQIDPNGRIKDKAALALLVGRSALTALAATAYFSGFAFYTTMAVTIKTVAGFFGLTLPFAVYTGAAAGVGALVAFLCGPIGWAIMGLAALGGIALAGRANVKKTAAFILQIHALKVAALMEAGVPEKEIFV